MGTDLQAVAIICITTYFSIALNIPILRQFSAFVFLTFVPGYLLMKTLRLKMDYLGIFLFSIGFSIASVMFLGLSLNAIGLAFNLTYSLSLFPVVSVISFLILALSLYCYKRSERELDKLESMNKPALRTIIGLFFLLFLVFLSIFGALSHNTVVLLFMILGIALFWAVSVFFDGLVPPRIFPLAIILVSLALLFHTTLITRHLIGSDVFLEFYVFRQTETAGLWHPPGMIASYSLTDSLNSVLSITVLPTIYSRVLGVNGEALFKLFYPIIFAIVPLVLYKIYTEQMDRKYALLSALFFVSTPITFYGLEPTSLNRQMIGELFFLLSVLLIVEKKLPIWKKRFVLVFFVSALIVSHYSLAYVLVIYIVTLFAYPYVSNFLTRIRRVETAQILSLAMVLLLITLTFFWYIYISDSPFNQLANSIHRIVNLFTTDLFSTEARVQPGLTSLSPTSASSVIGTIHRILIYVEHFFIGIGVLVLMFKRKEFGLTSEFRVMVLLSTTILVLSLLIPNVAPTLNNTRFYAIVIPFLAPLFVLGGMFIITTLHKHIVFSKRPDFPLKKWGMCMIGLVLITTFLFQIGFVNHISGGYPYSYSLDLERRQTSDDLSMRLSAYGTYFLDEDVFSARWLGMNKAPSSKVYADENSILTVLKSYGLLSDTVFLPITDTALMPASYVYLKSINVNLGLIDYGGESRNASDLLLVLGNCDVVFSNGASNIYMEP